MKRFIAMFTSFLLFLSVFSFGNSDNARAETQSSDVPVVNSITLSSDTVKRGEGLLIQVDIGDNSSGTVSCYGYFNNGEVGKIKDMLGSIKLGIINGLDNWLHQIKCIPMIH